MNKGGTFEAAGIGFTMVRSDHTGGATLTVGDGQVTRDFGSWGWILEFEDGTTVYHSGDTDVFGDMSLIRQRFVPEIAVLPIGGHYTMGPRDAGSGARDDRRLDRHPRPFRHLPGAGRHARGAARAHPGDGGCAWSRARRGRWSPRRRSRSSIRSRSGRSEARRPGAPWWRRSRSRSVRGRAASASDPHGSTRRAGPRSGSTASGKRDQRGADQRQVDDARLGHAHDDRIDERRDGA